MKTRVLQVIPNLRVGGAEMLIRNMVDFGFGEDFELGVLCLYRPSETFVKESIEASGVRFMHCDKKTGVDPALMFSTQVYSKIKSFRPEVVHTHLHALAYALLPCAALRVPARLHTIHNMAAMDCGKKSWMVNHAAFRLFNFTPVGISETIARTIKDFYGVNDVPVINNGIPTGKYKYSEEVRVAARDRLGLPMDVFTCVHVGRFSEQKNHRLLLRAFSKAVEKNPDMVLLLLGDGVLKDDIKSLVGELGLEGRVNLMGIRKDVPDILSASDLFVFSSNWEGLPLTVIEAMAAGLPVVSTRVGGVPDLVRDGENGFLVDKGDLEGLAGAVLKVASDPGMARSMGDKAAAVARDSFDISQTVRKHEMLYMSLLEKSRASCYRVGLHG